MVPSTPWKNQLPWPCSWIWSRISLSQEWNPSVSWNPRFWVFGLEQNDPADKPETRMPSSFSPV